MTAVLYTFLTYMYNSQWKSHPSQMSKWPGQYTFCIQTLEQIIEEICYRTTVNSMGWPLYIEMKDCVNHSVN